MNDYQITIIPNQIENIRVTSPRFDDAYKRVIRIDYRPVIAWKILFDINDVYGVLELGAVMPGITTEEIWTWLFYQDGAWWEPDYSVEGVGEDSMFRYFQEQHDMDDDVDVPVLTAKQSRTLDPA